MRRGCYERALRRPAIRPPAADHERDAACVAVGTLMRGHVVCPLCEGTKVREFAKHLACGLCHGQGHLMAPQAARFARKLRFVMAWER